MKGAARPPARTPLKWLSRTSGESPVAERERKRQRARQKQQADGVLSENPIHRYAASRR